MIWRKTFKGKNFLFYLISAACLVFHLSTAASSRADDPMDLVLLSAEGEKVRLGQIAVGNPLLLYFWATWCKPCRKTGPKVSAFAKDFRDQVKVVGINLGGVDSLEDIRRYSSRHKITYPQLLDPDNKASKAYSVFVIPTIILLDSNGKIRYRGNELPANLGKLLPK